MFPPVELRPVSRDDIIKLSQWLQDREVSACWYGLDQHGVPVHIGYSPEGMLAEPEPVFDDPNIKVFSVYTGDGTHIGEAQLHIDPALYSAEAFVLIGEPRLWFRGFGTATLMKLLDLAFDTYRLHRVSADVPEYNAPAKHMCERLGFRLEGRLRKTRRKDGEWHDSLVFGLLEEEYRWRKRQFESSQEVASA